MKAEGWYGLALVVTFSFFLNILILASPIFSMQVFDGCYPAGASTRSSSSPSSR